MWFFLSLGSNSRSTSLAQTKMGFVVSRLRVVEIIIEFQSQGITGMNRISFCRADVI